MVQEDDIHGSISIEIAGRKYLEVWRMPDERRFVADVQLSKLIEGVVVVFDLSGRWFEVECHAYVEVEFSTGQVARS